MARPTKSINVASKHNTKADTALRTQIENQLKDGQLPASPEWLTLSQAILFDRIIRYCEQSGILASVDEHSLAMFCVAADHMAEIEQLINADPDRMMDRNIMSARANYEKTFWRGCQEFCLTPQARAKIGSLAVAARKESEDPLAAALVAL